MISGRTETSSAEVGSSRTSTPRLDGKSAGDATRWAWPPESSCGIAGAAKRPVSRHHRRGARATRSLSGVRGARAGARAAPRAGPSRHSEARVERGERVLEDELDLARGVALLCWRSRSGHHFAVKLKLTRGGSSSPTNRRARVDLPRPALAHDAKRACRRTRSSETSLERAAGGRPRRPWVLLDEVGRPKRYDGRPFRGISANRAASTAGPAIEEGRLLARRSGRRLAPTAQAETDIPSSVGPGRAAAADLVQGWSMRCRSTGPATTPSRACLGVRVLRARGKALLVGARSTTLPGVHRRRPCRRGWATTPRSWVTQTIAIFVSDWSRRRGRGSAAGS